MEPFLSPAGAAPPLHKKKRTSTARTPTDYSADPRMRNMSPLRTPGRNRPATGPTPAGAASDAPAPHDRRPRTSGITTRDRGWPLLIGLEDADISTFLQKRQEFNLVRIQEDKTPIALRFLVDEKVLPGIPRFIRNMGGEADAARLPQDDQLHDIQPNRHQPRTSPAC